MRPKTLYKKVYEKWGLHAQLGMIQEECAELIQAVSKILRVGLTDKTFNNLVEETADVEIMIEQSKTFYDWKFFAEKVAEKKKEKLARLEAMLND